MKGVITVLKITQNVKPKKTVENVLSKSDSSWKMVITKEINKHDVTINAAYVQKKYNTKEPNIVILLAMKELTNRDQIT